MNDQAAIKEQAWAMAENLVKNIIATIELKIAMARGMTIEGSWSDIISDLATTFEILLSEKGGKEQ